MRWKFGIVFAAFCISVLMCAQTALGRTEFEYWEPDAAALKALTDYVETVTDGNNPDYIPESERVAVFDLDGTLMGESFPTYFDYCMYLYRVLGDPDFTPDKEMLDVANVILNGVRTGEWPDKMMEMHAKQAARAYAGMTLDEFRKYTEEFKKRTPNGFEGMTYAEAFYLPMLELVEYLKDNGFIIYIVSGCERLICRVLAEDIPGIASGHIIGTDVDIEASDQTGEDGLYYDFKEDDQIVRTDRLRYKDLNTNKVLRIVEEIGLQPVLAFGNSGSDNSMAMYTTSNNPHRSAAFMLAADDEERDYVNVAKAEKNRKNWEKLGWNVISMKNDFKTLYGDHVRKTKKTLDQIVPVFARETALRAA